MNDDILWKINSEIGKDKKVVELRKEIEDLTNSNNFWKRKCSEMGIALKTYEKGRYQEHLENERLNSIINELEDSIVGKINVLYQVRGQSNAIQELSILLRQLQELKGDDKE